MCLTGGDAPDVEIPASTIEQGKMGVRRQNNWRTDGFKKLEEDAITDSNVNRAEILERSGNADIAQLERQANSGPKLNGPNAFDIAKTGEAVEATSGEMQSAAAKKGFSNMQERKVGVAKTGADLMKNSDQAMNSVAGNDLNTAFTDTQNKVMKDNARFSAGMSVAEGVAAGAIGRWKRNQALDDAV